MLTATDGSLKAGNPPDKMRMKIWNEATGQIVYDNLLGAADSTSPTTALGGGSIVIHAASGGGKSGSGQIASLRPEAPIRYVLNPARPNPSRGQATVSFDLPEASEVWIEVFDVQGRQAVDLIRATLDAGRYELPWGARSRERATLEPGIYLLRMRARSIQSAAVYESTSELVLSR